MTQGKADVYSSSHNSFVFSAPSRFKHFDPGLSRSLWDFPGFGDNLYVCCLLSVLCLLSSLARLQTVLDERIAP